MEIIFYRTVIFLLIGAFIVLCAWMFYREFQRKMHELDERIKKLESATPKRMPHASQEEILDGMAALEVLMREFTFGVDVVENAKAHFAKALQVGTKREEEK